MKLIISVGATIIPIQLLLYLTIFPGTADFEKLAMKGITEVLVNTLIIIAMFQLFTIMGVLATRAISSILNQTWGFLLSWVTSASISVLFFVIFLIFIKSRVFAIT